MAVTKGRVLFMWSKQGVIVLLTTALGFVVGWLWATYFNRLVPVETFAPWGQAFSGMFFLWTALGIFGEILTYNGDSPAEQLNMRILQALACLGMFVLFACSFAMLFV